ncbi:sensor histidine kinase [Pseudoalteromonas fenneropenaei]|uniref:histidine kinase n=1 Tax=Pseudoalteromonas fenneropenaei TaxID=1737459 RepID=A0ABV7CHL9_9GAMM
MNTRQIRNKVIAYFASIALLVSVLFAAMSLLFAYIIEDTLFELLLRDERQHISAQLEKGLQPHPKLDFIRYYPSEQALPDVIRTTLAEEPNRIEFSGNHGEHFHLLKLETGFLVADVSTHLVVREFKGAMLGTYVVMLAVMLLVALVLALMSLALAKRLLLPLDKLMAIINEAPVEQLPNNFASQFQQDEIGSFASALQDALNRIQAFVQREQAFTREVSHELRTPLAVSEGALSLLEQTKLSDVQADYVARLRLAAQQMNQSIAGLMVLAREENHSLSATRVLPVVERVVLQYVSLIGNKPIELNINIDRNLQLKISEAVLTLLLSNLIQNAFTHTKQGTVTVAYQHGCLLVNDEGSGIAAELLPDVFCAGIKGPESNGSGLGLAIVKRVCERLNLPLTLDTHSAGTCFRIAITAVTA